MEVQYVKRYLKYVLGGFSTLPQAKVFFGGRERILVIFSFILYKTTSVLVINMVTLINYWSTLSTTMF